MRPSLLFGPGDSFFNRFATLTRLLPVLPLAGADTRFQPVYAGDVAEAIVGAVDGKVPGGRVYEFGGPQVAHVARTGGVRAARSPSADAASCRCRLPLARMQGSRARHPRPVDPRPPAGRAGDDPRPGDPARERQRGVGQAAAQEGRTLEGLGITPTAYEGLVDSYLLRFRKTGQFDFKRNAPTIPDIEAPPSVGPLAEGGPGHPTTTAAPTTGH